MTRVCASQISTNDSTARNNGLSAKNDVLWASNRCSSGYFVPGILQWKVEKRPFGKLRSTYSFDVFGFGIVYWWFHGKVMKRWWMAIYNFKPQGILALLENRVRYLFHNAGKSSVYRTPIQALWRRRQFLSCTTRKQANSSTSSLDSSIQGSKVTQDNFVYRGPLTKPFRNLKIFSLSSIGLTVSLSPVLFVIDSGLPMTARISLASIALGTSSLSTALIAFCAKPYVTSMRRFRPDRTGSAEVIEMTTQSLFLKPLVTTVSDSPIPWDSVL